MNSAETSGEEHFGGRLDPGFEPTFFISSPLDNIFMWVRSPRSKKKTSLRQLLSSANCQDDIRKALFSPPFFVQKATTTDDVEHGCMEWGGGVLGVWKKSDNSG